MKPAVPAAAAFACLFASGAAGLIAEVCWIRRAALAFGSTIDALSTVLAVFFLGLALGGYLFGELVAAPRTAAARLRRAGDRPGGADRGDPAAVRPGGIALRLAVSRRRYVGGRPARRARRVGRARASRAHAAHGRRPAALLPAVRRHAVEPGGHGRAAVRHQHPGRRAGGGAERLRAHPRARRASDDPACGRPRPLRWNFRRGARVASIRSDQRAAAGSAARAGARHRGCARAPRRRQRRRPGGVLCRVRRPRQPGPVDPLSGPGHAEHGAHLLDHAHRGAGRNRHRQRPGGGGGGSRLAARPPVRWPAGRERAGGDGGDAAPGGRVAGGRGTGRHRHCCSSCPRRCRVPPFRWRCAWWSTIRCSPASASAA